MVRIPAGYFIQGSTDQQVKDVYDICIEYDDYNQCWRTAFEDELPQRRTYVDEFWGGSLFCDIVQRYLWLRQTYG